MSLSKAERQILAEMERTLRKQDRAFVDRVNKANILPTAKSALSAMIAFTGGFTLLLAAFGSSVLFGCLGFLVMLVSSLVFVRHSLWSGLVKPKGTDTRITSDL